MYVGGGHTRRRRRCDCSAMYECNVMYVFYSILQHGYVFYSNVMYVFYITVSIILRWDGYHIALGRLSYCTGSVWMSVRTPSGGALIGWPEA